MATHRCGPTCNSDRHLRLQRLLKKTERVGACLVWTGTVLANGYGSMRVHYRREYVHRIAYEFAFGPVPTGLHIDHLCRTRLCVEPAHLEAVTPGENTRRGAPFRQKRIVAKPAYCSKGHAMTEANTYKPKRGWKCRQCSRDYANARYVPRVRKVETHCRRGGHEFTPENTIIQVTGARTCRACRLASKRRAYAKTR